MSLWPQLRALVFLRRIVKALERIASADEDRARIVIADWERRHRAPSPHKRSFDIGSFDVGEANKAWHAARVERGEETEGEG